MFRSVTALLLTATIAGAAMAAPATTTARDAGSGMATGKVAMQDMHFSSEADAAAHCDKAPVSKAPDGSFTCAMPSSSDMAINEKGLPGNKTKPASKPQ